VHVHGWSSERALRFFIEQTGASRSLAENVVLRSACEPGQLCAYKIGLLTMRSLHDDYRRVTEPRFDLRAFHDAVLGGGALPFDALRRSVLDRALEERNR
jgi:uncharacterized protein (DUF885 family)